MFLSRVGGLITEPIRYRGDISKEQIDSKDLLTGIYRQGNDSVGSGGTTLYHGVLLVLSVDTFYGKYGIHVYMQGDSKNKLMRVQEYGNLSNWVKF